MWRSVPGDAKDQLCPGVRAIVCPLYQGCEQPGPLGNLSRRVIWEPAGQMESLHSQSSLPVSFHSPLHFSLSSTPPPQFPVTPCCWTIKEGMGCWPLAVSQRGRAVIMSVVVAAGLMMSHQPENPRAVGPPSPPGSASACFSLPRLPKQCSTAMFYLSHKGGGGQEGHGVSAIQPEAHSSRREMFHHSHFSPVPEF